MERTTRPSAGVPSEAAMAAVITATSSISSVRFSAAETAGELLGLDPTRVYTMAELDDALRERVRLERDRQGGQELTLDTLPGEGGSLAEALAALGKELALLSVLENLAQYLAGEAPILRPGLLAAALPREFLACLYLIVAL